jgi:hypothetical protein
MDEIPVMTDVSNCVVRVSSNLGLGVNLPRAGSMAGQCALAHSLARGCKEPARGVGRYTFFQHVAEGPIGQNPKVLFRSGSDRFIRARI